MSDIFVALPPATRGNCVIFGKNSGRPAQEVQEVVYHPAANQGPGKKLKCTWIEVDESDHTNSVILSKPAWAWGAEMGSNEYGLCVGNTAIWTKMCPDGSTSSEPGLLGIDLVRLALERAKTSREAVDVITAMLEKYGQGGVCYEDKDFKDLKHDSSFMIADQNEAWILETAGHSWVAKKIKEGVCNLSNQLSLGKDVDLKSSHLEERTEKLGFWKPNHGELDFSCVYAADIPGVFWTDDQKPAKRFEKGKKLMEAGGGNDCFSLENMSTILRDEDSSINMVGKLMTTASQVSILWPQGSGIPDCHWFTATPNPNQSVFKPFVFCSNANIGKTTVSPDGSAGDRRHALYKLHEKFRGLLKEEQTHAKQVSVTLRSLQKVCIEETNAFLSTYDESKHLEIPDLFKDIAESELKFYR